MPQKQRGKPIAKPKEPRTPKRTPQNNPTALNQKQKIKKISRAQKPTSSPSPSAATTCHASSAAAHDKPEGEKPKRGSGRGFGVVGKKRKHKTSYAKLIPSKTSAGTALSAGGGRRAGNVSSAGTSAAVYLVSCCCCCCCWHWRAGSAG